MKRVVITGANGFIGRALTKRLLNTGSEVWAIVRNIDSLKELESKKLHIVSGNFENYESISSLILDRSFDAFYHFAWQGVFGNAFQDYELQLKNAAFSCKALMAAVELGCQKFIFAGTYNEFEVKGFMDDPSYQPRYTCIYASAKLTAELMCRTLAYQNGIIYHAGLPCMVYGENNRSEMLPNVVLRQLLTGVEPSLIEGKNYYDLVYVEDVAAAFEAIGERGVNGKSYYIGHRKLTTFRELLCDMRDIVAPNIGLNFGAFQDTSAMDYSRIGLDELYQDTGFECRADFKESILRTAEWLRQQQKG